MGTARQAAEQAVRDQKDGVLTSPEGYAKIIAELLAETQKRPSHEELVLALAKPGDEILKTMDAQKMDLLHMAVGISGEAGELLDWVKKHVVYNQPLDTVSKEDKTILYHISEEMEDAVFYMKKIMLRFGWTWKDLEDRNISKLLKRYSGMVYTDQAAQTRADKS